MNKNGAPEAIALSGRPARLLESVAFVAVFLVASYAIDAGLHVADLRMPREAAVSILVRICAFVVVSIVIQKRLGGKMLEMLALRPAPVAAYVLTAVAIVGVALFLPPFDGYLSRTYGFYHRAIQIDQSLFVRKDLVGTALRSLLISPVLEEALFRGIIFAGLSRNYRLPTAILASSLLFTLYHLNPAQFMGPLLGGILFAAAYHRSNSLFPSIMGHFLNNLIWFLSTAYHFSVSSIVGTSAASIAIRVVIGLVMFAASVALLLIASEKRRRNGQKTDEVTHYPSAI